MALILSIIRAVTQAIRHLTLGKVPVLFDAVYYRATYPEVCRLGIDPYLHYVLIGRGKRYNPAEDFDARFYIQQSGWTRQNPIRHYMRQGAKLGLDPNPNFSTQAYLDLHPDVKEGEHNPLAHYRIHGRVEGRRILPSTFGRIYARKIEAGELTPFSGTFADLSLGIAPPEQLVWRAQDQLILKVALDEREIEALTQALKWQRFRLSDFHATISVQIFLNSEGRSDTATAHLILNDCLRSDVGETTWICYSELRLVDLRPIPPKLITFATSGNLRFVSPDIRL